MRVVIEPSSWAADSCGLGSGTIDAWQLLGSVRLAPVSTSLLLCWSDWTLVFTTSPPRRTKSDWLWVIYATMQVFNGEVHQWNHEKAIYELLHIDMHKTHETQEKVHIGIHLT